MRLLVSLLPLLAGVAPSLAEGQTTTEDGSVISIPASLTGSISEATLPTGNYITYSSTKTLSNENGDNTMITSANATGSPTSTLSSNATSTSDALTVLVGGQTSLVLGNSTANATRTASTSPSAAPVVNTRPCNGFPELCPRSYSNITMVAAHNSPFTKPGNIASNQMYDVESQLNDGIRMLQFQTHLVNGTLLLCHTSCELLNMGTLESYLTTVADWMRKHPYDVVTILMGNFDLVAPGNFTAPIQNSGLMDMVYTPSMIPMSLGDWPPLSNMIMTGKRAVMFLDYQANQTAYPWLMDEFSQIWETPFSPTDPAFPCTAQRPPNLDAKAASNRMYMANHNLNLQVNFASISLLIPNTAQLDKTNADSGFGSLGAMSQNCTQTWNRPPNFLLVDYYNFGNFNGSVFQVAAQANGLNYTGNCCGTTSGASHFMPGQNTMGVLLLAAGIQALTSMF